MDKKVPIYFDSVIVSSPVEKISTSNPNLSRLKVRVFTKYGNRNGSYITDAVADQLIESACSGLTPVVGFFDPQSQTWASHTGPTLANAYGYVESFLGWEPFTDTDGVVRDYATFSVVLFTDYFEEAQKILGQNQSMELDPESITGDWANIENQEYYVYNTAKMLGFCIIGDHEPCFSVSSFFSKNDDTYNSQYEKFSSLLFNLKTQVEEAEKNIEGGEQPMEELSNMEAVEPVVEEPQIEETFEAVEEEPVVEEPVVEEPAAAEEPVTVDFEALQNQLDELQASYNELNTNYEAAQIRISQLESELETSAATLTELQGRIAAYEVREAEAMEAKKNELVEKYEKVLAEEEIALVRETIKDFSYEELESKLAIMFANANFAGSVEKKVPLPEPQESQFALLMKKYRKN